MKKLRLGILALSGIAPLLLSCMGNGSSASYSKPENVCTVNYYDDSPEKNLIGYSYTIKGHRSNMKNAGDVPYDYLSRSGVAPEMGSRHIFSSFSGTYEDGTPVDLSSIQGDCEVIATFTQEAIPVSFVFKDDTDKLRDENGDIIRVSAGYGESFPAFPSGDNVKYLIENAPYGYKRTFKGFSLTSDPLDIVSNDGTAMVSWIAPEDGNLTSDLGKVGDLSLKRIGDTTNPDYELFAKGKDGWATLGTLGNGKEIVLNALADETEREFPIDIVYVVNGVVSSERTFHAPYRSVLTIGDNEAGVSIQIGEDSVAAYTGASLESGTYRTIGEQKGESGVYTEDDVDRHHSGMAVDFSTTDGISVATVYGSMKIIVVDDSSKSPGM